MKQLLGVVSVFLLFGTVAFPQDVSYNFDQQADFSKFKTYKWVATKSGEKLDSLTSKQLTDAVDRQLATKGLTKADSGNADLYVGYQFALSREEQLTTFDSGYSTGPGWGGRWYGGYYGGGMTSSATSTIHIGSVALDMYDSAKKQLVWRGVASKQLDTQAKSEKREKNLKKGTEKLLKHYPPRNADSDRDNKDSIDEIPRSIPRSEN